MWPHTKIYGHFVISMLSLESNVHGSGALGVSAGSFQYTLQYIQFLTVSVKF